MSFFVEPSSTPGGPGIKPGTGLDAVTDVETLIRHAPHMADRFDAIQDLRAQTPADIAIKKDFFRVASIPHTVWYAACELEPDLPDNKPKFYAWLKRNPQYRTYTPVKGGQ